MNITPKTIAYAIHRLLAARDVQQGCTVPLRALAEDWPHTLLRKTDLGVGIEALRKSGHVALEHTPEGPVLRLLDEQFGMIRTLQDREAVATLARLREARRRPKAHVAALLGARPTGRRRGEPGAESRIPA